VDRATLEQVFFPSFFGFLLSVIIPPLLHTNISTPHVLCDSPDQAAHYHILVLQVAVFILDPVLGWLQRYSL
jgi:hypothetical protein